MQLLFIAYKIHYRMESSYKEGRVGSPIKRFNLATFLYLSQARTWVSKVIYRSFYVINDIYCGKEALE